MKILNDIMEFSGVIFLLFSSPTLSDRQETWGVKLKVLRTMIIQVAVWKIMFSKRSSESLAQISPGRGKS